MHKLKALREKAGLSQKDLSRMCDGMSIRYLDKVEKGSRSGLTQKKVKQLAIALGVDKGEIVHAAGSVLRTMREDAGMSQEDISNLCDTMCRSMVGAIERGDRDPSPDMMRELAAALGVPPREVLDAVMSERGL